MHWAGWVLAFLDGLTQAGISWIWFPSGKQTKTFQEERLECLHSNNICLKFEPRRPKYSTCWSHCIYGFTVQMHLLTYTSFPHILGEESHSVEQKKKETFQGDKEFSSNNTYARLIKLRAAQKQGDNQYSKSIQTPYIYICFFIYWAAEWMHLYTTE